MQRRHFIQSAGALALGTALSPLISQTAFAAPQSASTLEVFAGAIGPGMYNGGTFAQARFHDPRGMALDGQGNIFVADYVNSVVRKLGTDGQVSIVAGQVEQRDARNGPALQARFYSPECVAVATDGTLFVSDSGSNTVRRISREWQGEHPGGQAGGRRLCRWAGQQARFNHPVGLA
jgi:NHL repeat.